MNGSNTFWLPLLSLFSLMSYVIFGIICTSNVLVSGESYPRSVKHMDEENDLHDFLKKWYSPLHWLLYPLSSRMMA